MLNLSILTPNKKLVTDLTVEEVLVPGFRGELNILPGHARLVTTLSTGILRYRLAGKSDWNLVSVSWGYCEIKPNSIIILAETAETSEELDADRIGKALAFSVERLGSGALEGEEITKYQRKHERALIRQELLEVKSNSDGHTKGSNNNSNHTH